MSTMQAVVRNGKLETDERIDLPDGTRVDVTLTEAPIDIDDDSPEGIAAWHQWYASLEPLELTAEEREAWARAKQERKEQDIAHFDEMIEQARKLWDK